LFENITIGNSSISSEGYYCVQEWAICQLDQVLLHLIVSYPPNTGFT